MRSVSSMGSTSSDKRWQKDKKTKRQKDKKTKRQNDKMTMLAKCLTQVALVAIMGGAYPGGQEFNFDCGEVGGVVTLGGWDGHPGHLGMVT